MHHRIICLAVVLAICSWAFDARCDITIANFSDVTNNRFTNDASFIGAGFDFSGVARTTDNGRWGTLIGRNAVLTARHRAPSIGSTFEFFPSNDPSSQSHAAVVDRHFSVADADLTVSILDRNVDPSIRHYNLAATHYTGRPPITETDSEGNETTTTFLETEGIDIVGRRALTVGISPTISGGVFQIDMAVGENLVTAYSENVDFLGRNNNDSIVLEFNSVSDPNRLFHEAYVQSGDSGAPTFLIDNGELVLLGANSFQLNSTDGSFRATGVTYVGNDSQYARIQEILADNAIVTTVPEPGGLALTLLTASFVLIQRRRR